MSYLKRLRDRAAPTGKTGKSPLSNQESAQPATGKTGKSPLLPVLPVPPAAIPENSSPWPDLCRGWFAGIEEPRAMVTLTPSEARRAVALGAVPEEVAEACVLLAYRSPLGACGLLAIPREKWEPFAAVEILETAPCLH